jgi:alkanesulfonate monooxygenase SsuD/methylene tetrahydromethanopterin reductase-like flavin-dependent oxidoreductase (luciferase family)
MRYAINVPNFGEYSDPRTFMRLAVDAERSGWDGFFVWDHILVDPDWGVPIADPWVLLSAAAAVTQTIRLGPMVTPLARRRPWVVARQASTLDHLSGGRVTLGVGLGTPPEVEFGAFGEDDDARVRAAKLDEALAILTGLWSGEPFEHAGAHYQLKRMRFAPPPVQRPRIPIWVAGYWPARAPFRRAARWDGAFPISKVTEESGALMPLAELAEITSFLREERGAEAAGQFDVVALGSTPADPLEAGEILAPYAAAGVTWWCEALNGMRAPLAELEERLRAGPPRLP